jgi:hypothetical protein
MSRARWRRLLYWPAIVLAFSLSYVLSTAARWRAWPAILRGLRQGAAETACRRAGIEESGVRRPASHCTDRRQHQAARTGGNLSHACRILAGV